MRDISLFKTLEQALDQIPITQRSYATLEFDLVDDAVCNNLETIYQIATQRLIYLAYYLEWAKTLDGNAETRPDAAEASELHVQIAFHNIDELSPSNIEILNNSLSSWIKNQTLRELNEFLMYFLLGIYETCQVINYANKTITPQDIVKGQKAYRQFEKGDLKDRLKKLNSKFDINITHREAVRSLYEIRNVFSHFDGIVPKKLCKNNDRLKVLWPVNTYKL